MVKMIDIQGIWIEITGFIARVILRIIGFFVKIFFPKLLTNGLGGQNE